MIKLIEKQYLITDENQEFMILYFTNYQNGIKNGND